MATTDRCYARYCERGHVRPLELEPDEVLPDLLARLQDRDPGKKLRAASPI